jgi:hypothetical protein
MYFFALPTDRGLEIDSVADELDDSCVYEAVDVEDGLVAWDGNGMLFRFEPYREREGAGWAAHRIGQDAERFVEVLRHFLLYILHRRRRATALGINEARIRKGSRDELIEFARPDESC